MKTRRIHIIIVIAALLPGIGSCSKKDVNQAVEPIAVDVAYPEVDSVLIHKTYPGVISANSEVKLVARVNGYLVSKDYVSGSFVKKGTVLFRIEDSNYRNQVAQAEAALSTAQANLKYASTHYAAMVEALKSDAVSGMEVAQALSSKDDAEAAVKNAEAALSTARTQLSYCTVRAPFDGHVSGNIYDVGAYLSGAGAPVELASIYDDTLMCVAFSIEDSEALGKLRQNYDNKTINYNSIPLSFSENTQHQYTLRLDYFAPTVDKLTGTMVLKGLVSNPYNELKSGMYASVSLPVAVDPRAILVNDASIGTDQQGRYLYTVNDSDKVVYTPVKVGDLIGDSLRIITSGLTPKDRYVTKAVMKVRDGMTVKPVISK